MVEVIANVANRTPLHHSNLSRLIGAKDRLPRRIHLADYRREVNQSDEGDGATRVWVQRETESLDRRNLDGRPK